jgi:hypothetical protein
MTERNLNALVRKFVAAGRAEIRMETGTARDAAHAVMRANAVRARACRVLGERTKPGHSDYAVKRSWSHAHRALQHHRKRLDRWDEVLGYGLSYRRKGGEETDEKCVVLFVRDKLTPAQLKRLERRALPKTLRAGKA